MSDELSFDERRMLKELTTAQKRNLLALPSDMGGYATVAEMRSGLAPLKWRGICSA
ncbi:hypothetical protein ACQKJZ_17635 [Sphingomonas sp. NPDC019816]|uniref:hypothetical protein n=1 Tax=Sphingomonas sp. NPDC019816 TaxID=3390679 RepID=UPI003D02F127